MQWKILALLTTLCVVGHYGVMPFFYFTLACACFIFGLLFGVDKLDHSGLFSKRKCEMSKGLPAVTAIMDCAGVSRPNIKMSASPALDVVLNQIISYILRDYIYSWYAPLTTDAIFPTELHRLLQQILANLLRRISQNNWTPFLTELLPSYMASHIKLYRLMLDRKDACPDKDPVKLFFDCELESEMTVCREKICISREEEEKYLRSLCDMFLFFILPAEEYRVPAIRYIARELLVCTVLLPTVDLLSDPDFVNRSVSWLAKDSAFTSEYFVQSLRMSDSAEELTIVVQQINNYMDKLRGFDSGGLDDASIKAQLGSLDYVRKVCARRLQQIKEGVSEKSENFLAYHLQPGMRLHDMTFDEVMSTSVALVSFLDYLSSVDKDPLLRLYLNCVSYRENAKSILADEDRFSSSGCFGASSSNSESLDIDGVSLRPADCTERDREIVFSSDTNTDANDVSPYLAVSTEKSIGEEDVAMDCTDSSKSANVVDDLKAFGVVLCNNLLKQLPPSAEPLVQPVLRRLTTNPSVCDPTAFATIESKLLEMLSNAQCFGAFKRSSHYVQLLAELDLLKDSSDQPPNLLLNEAVPNDMTLFPKEVEPDVATTESSVGDSDGTSGFLVSKQTPAGGSFINPLRKAFKFIPSEENTPISDPKKRPEAPASLLSSPSACITPHAESYTAQIIRTEIMHDSYVLYTLKVTCTSVITGHTDCWQTLRRYSHFAELHSLITERYTNIPKLKLPPKRAFSNMGQQFLSRRRRELNEYLLVLCSPDFLANYPQLRPLVVEFLQPDGWERFHSQMREISGFNPFRSVGNAMRAVPETLADSFSRVLNAMQPNSQGSSMSTQPNHGRLASIIRETSHLPDFTSGKGGESVDQMEDGPIGAFFLLVDEMFSLRQKSHLSRDTNFVILRKIFQAFFGPRVNKMIIAKAKELTSSHRLAEFLAYLRDYIWPPSDSTRRTSQLTDRDREMKLRTRVLCRTMLLGSVSEDLAQFLGNETTRRGVSRVFRLLQNEPLNRRLVYCILEAVLCQMFRAHRARWEYLFEEQLCPSKTGRSCRAHPSVS